MKKLRDFTLTNEEWKFVKFCFLKFYKEINECDVICPMGFDHRMHKFSSNQLRLKNQIFKKKGSFINNKCICHQFKEFKNLNHACPCHVLGQKAFIQLEKFVKRECLNEKTP